MNTFLKTLKYTSFLLCSGLIALAAWLQALDESWLVCLLTYASAICAIWALAGVYNPQSLFFAHPINRTRGNAFFFPFRLFCIFAVCAGLEAHGDEAFNPATIIAFSLCLPFAVRRAVGLRVPAAPTVNKTPVAAIFP